MSNVILKRWAGVLSAGSGDAIVSPSGEVMRTWEDIDVEARDFEGRIAHGGKGVVALQTGNHASFPALLLACLRTGRPAALFDEGFSGDHRSQIEKQLGVALRVTASNGEIFFEGDGGETPGGAGCRGDICLYKLTSGTTSLPRPIGFTGPQLVADCDQVCATMGIGVGDLNYGVISMAHSYGLSNLVTPLLCRGIPLVVASDPLPRAIENGLRSTCATVLPAVPAMFRGLLSAPSLPDSLRLCISAGAPLSPALGRDFFEKFHRKIHTFYGASECGGICYDATGAIIDLDGFVGEPLQGVEIGISEDGEGSKIVTAQEAS